MDLEQLFEAMDAAGIGRPRDVQHLGSYAPWYSIYQTVLRKRPLSEALSQIPWTAKAMGKTQKVNEADNEQMMDDRRKGVPLSGVYWSRRGY